MAITYSENFVTRKAVSDITGTGADYRIEYIVRNPEGGPVKTIVATISQVTSEGEPAVEKLTRVGNASVDIANNRNYLAFEKHAEVTADNQAAIAAKYFADVKEILAEV